MKTYEVTFRTTGREVYRIDAVSIDDAEARAMEDGAIVNSEAYDSELYSTDEVES